MLSVAMLNIIYNVSLFHCYAECHYSVCYYAESHYSECHYAECLAYYHYVRFLGDIALKQFNDENKLECFQFPSNLGSLLAALAILTKIKLEYNTRLL